VSLQILINVHYSEHEAELATQTTVRYARMLVRGYDRVLGVLQKMTSDEEST
jgi:hypothetical protein